MGKVTSGTGSAPDVPSFIGGNFSINGNSVANTVKNGDYVSSNYYASPYETFLNDYVQKTLSSSLPQMNTFLPETVQRINTEFDAYKNKGIQSINEMYTPMVKNMQNDIATRFGNFDNSMFMENLKGLESQRGNTINQFAQDLQSKQSQLYNDELQKQYDFINLLMNVQNNQFGNMLKALGVSQGNATLGNNQAQQEYQAQYRNYLSNQQSSQTADIWKKVLSTALTATGYPGAGTAMNFF